jgi:hypothetical protein
MREYLMNERHGNNPLNIDEFLFYITLQIRYINF